MAEVNFEGAKAYALERLAQELSPVLFYHSIGHTRDDVVPATLWLAEQENVVGEDRLILVTAAWFHDLGYTEGLDDHESTSKRIAAQVLPEFGYSVRQIDVIHGLIEATRVPQLPGTPLEEIMADADLDSLGRKDYFDSSHALYVEMLSLGNKISPQEWIVRQLKFLKDHTYFTNTSKTFRGPVKLENIAALEAILDQIQTSQ